MIEIEMQPKIKGLPCYRAGQPIPCEAVNELVVPVAPAVMQLPIKNIVLAFGNHATEGAIASLCSSWPSKNPKT